MYIHRMVKMWSDQDAEHYFELQRFQPYDPNHSCYGCYDDDWKKSRRKCQFNGPRWDRVNSGDREWAARTIKQYKILPSQFAVENEHGVVQFEMKVGLA